MVVMILERVTPSLRGELTRWLIQPRAGVFVGRIPARVRDRLWQRASRSLRSGGATMIYSSNSEQGFAVRTSGDTSKAIVDFEGLLLPKTPVSP